MSSGIFGPRAPSYLPPSSNYFDQRTAAYGVRSPNSYVSGNSSYFRAPSAYTAAPHYSSAPQYFSYNTQPLPATTLYPGNPYLASPAGFWYAGELPQYPQSMYSYAQQNRIDIPSKGLEAILVAILVLVSLDLVVIRPLKQSP